VPNHPLGLTGEVVIYRHRCGARFAPRETQDLRLRLEFWHYHYLC
jgi:hypothetical protein